MRKYCCIPMEHHFTLSVVLNEEELFFPGRLVTFGYTYTFYVVVDKHEIVFERDEEMSLRVISLDSNSQVDVELLGTIGEAIEKREHLLTVS